MSSAPASSIPVSQLGLTNDEVSVLRQAQADAGGAGSSSSRAASRASSQGLLLLDSSSLTQLGRHFDRLMQHIQQQMDYLSEQSQIVTMSVYDSAGNLIDNADAEIRRYNNILAQMDELELDFDRIQHIRDIVRGYRQRVQQLERELEASQPSNSSSRHPSSSSSRHGHHSSSHGHGHSSSSHRHGHSSSRRERH